MKKNPLLPAPITLYRSFSYIDMPLGKVFFSYEEPVAIALSEFDCVGRRLSQSGGRKIRRKEFISKTTSRHLNRFCPSTNFEPVGEDEWYTVLCYVMGVEPKKALNPELAREKRKRPRGTRMIRIQKSKEKENKRED